MRARFDFMNEKSHTTADTYQINQQAYNNRKILA
jgi:hypothetical protein